MAIRECLGPGPIPAAADLRRRLTAAPRPAMGDNTIPVSDGTLLVRVAPPPDPPRAPRLAGETTVAVAELESDRSPTRDVGGPIAAFAIVLVAVAAAILALSC